MTVPNDRRRSQRARGYLSATLRTHTDPVGIPAHIFEISRHGGYISTDAGLRPGEGIALDIVFLNAQEYAPGAPDLLSLPAHVVEPISENTGHAEHYRIQFTDSTVQENWQYIDALVRKHNMRGI